MYWMERTCDAIRENETRPENFDFGYRVLSTSKRGREALLARLHEFYRDVVLSVDKFDDEPAEEICVLYVGLVDPAHLKGSSPP